MLLLTSFRRIIEQHTHNSSLQYFGQKLFNNSVRLLNVLNQLSVSERENFIQCDRHNKFLKINFKFIARKRNMVYVSTQQHTDTKIHEDDRYKNTLALNPIFQYLRSIFITFYISIRTGWRYKLRSIYTECFILNMIFEK